MGVARDGACAVRAGISGVESASSAPELPVNRCMKDGEESSTLKHAPVARITDNPRTLCCCLLVSNYHNRHLPIP